MILAGDVGGTHTRVALLEQAAGKLQVTSFELYRSRDHASLEQIVEAFLKAHPAELEAACIGVAGPVKEARAVVTNLPWAVDSRALAGQLYLPRVELINDLEANAWGLSVLGSTDFVVLNSGLPVEGAAVVISAGTGLGQAGLFWTGSEHLPMASEGGHADFAPRNAIEVELLLYLQRKLGNRVSYERALSGPGLVNLYSFLRERGEDEEPEWLAKKIAAGDAAAEISAAADRCTLAHKALELFVSIYGAATGNVALHFMATAGVFLGGGIAPKIISRLKGKTFLDAYLDKGRLSPLLAEIPVRVIMNDRAALFGAAVRAWRSLLGG
jgi:glucokinase